MKKDLLTLRDLTAKDMLTLISRGREFKKGLLKNTQPLKGKTVGMVFDKSSTRTRVSFEVAAYRLGGNVVFMTPSETQIGRNEPTRDTARILSSYLDGLVIRTYSHKLIDEFARWSDVPVINALTDLAHPCQILSDLMTIAEIRGSIDNIKIGWIGDGNNVANSWINAASVLNFGLTLACPKGYLPNPDLLDNVEDNVKLVSTPQEAASGADILYTDVWASMGDENEDLQRKKDFTGWQINQSLVDLAKDDVKIMHCLPAHRGEEITDDVLEGPRSIVFAQAENKLYIHQAVIEKFIL